MDTRISKEIRGVFKQLNKETKKHSHSVASLCTEFAPLLNLDPDIAYKVGLVHDLGKVYIPSCILRKNWQLTSLERMIIDLHAYYGYYILKHMCNEEPVIYLPVLYHHGFNKKKLSIVKEQPSEEVFAYTCLVHTVDIFEAMSSKRIYHDPEEMERIFEVLKKDDLCSSQLLDVIKEKGFNEESEENGVVIV